jgi:hypothetical protein
MVAGSNLIIDTAACYLESSYNYWKERDVKTTNASRIVRRATRIIQKSIKQSSTQTGDEILEKIEFLLSKGFGIQRSEMQVDIHKNFIISCLPKIFQDSWTQNKARIMKRFNVKQVIQEVLVVMPRRRGKTYSTAMFAAACLLCIPECSCIIFGTGERITKLLMTVISDMFEKAFKNGALKKEDYVFETNNKESMVFTGPDGTKRSLMCLPGSVRVKYYFFFIYMFCQKSPLPPPFPCPKKR